MKEDKVLDDELSGDKKLNRRNRLLLVAVVLALLSYVLNYYTPHHIHPSGEQLKKSGFDLIIPIGPLLSLILGAIIAIIPFRQLSYLNKLSHVALILYITFLIFYFLGNLLTCFYAYMGFVFEPM